MSHKFPRNLPDFRDELKRLRDEMAEDGINILDNHAAVYRRLEILIGCLTEIIVDQARD